MRNSADVSVFCRLVSFVEAKFLYCSMSFRVAALESTSNYTYIYIYICMRIRAWRGPRGRENQDASINRQVISSNSNQFNMVLLSCGLTNFPERCLSFFKCRSRRSAPARHPIPGSSWPKSTTRNCPPSPCCEWSCRDMLYMCTVDYIASSG